MYWKKQTFPVSSIHLFVSLALINAALRQVTAESGTTVLEKQNDTSACPSDSWIAMSELLSVTKSRMVFVFINESSAIPNRVLHQLHRSATRVVSIAFQNMSLDTRWRCHMVLLDCSPDQPFDQYDGFLQEMESKCRSFCTFLVFCNRNITSMILDMYRNYDLLRPWTLWVFDDPVALMILDDIDLAGTGVLVAVPSENEENDELSLSNNFCTGYDGITVYSGNSMTEIAKFGNLIEQESFESGEVNATWIQKSILEGTGGTSAKHRLLNMFNQTVQVAVKTLPPFLDDHVKDNVTYYTGVCMNILNVFAKVMNFRYELIPMIEIGRRKKSNTSHNEKWTGIIGAIQSRRVDLALGALTITEARAEVVDFTHPFLEDTSSILSIRPKQRNRILIFIRVFPWQVWLLLIISLVMLGPTFTILERGWKCKDYKINEDKGKEPEVEFDLWQSWWALIASVVQKGDLSPRSTPARVLAVFWLMFLVVLVGTYSGMLLAVMSFPGLEPAIDTLKQLTSSSSPFPLSLAATATSMYINSGETATTAQIKQRWKVENNLKLPRTPEDAFAMMEKGDYALISERMIFRYIISVQLEQCGCCPYYEANEDFLKQYYSFIVPKNSALIYSINILIQRMMQYGIIQFWLKNDLPNIAQCQETRTTTEDMNRPMGLADIQGAFYILGIGLVAATISLGCEVGVAKRLGRRKVKDVSFVARTTKQRAARINLIAL